MRIGNVITGDDALNGVEAVQATVIDAAGKSSITVPGADFILTAQYARIGSNLVLTSPDGDTEFVIRDYFATETPPDLFGDTGARIAGDLAARLSGPLAPGQYAQAGPITGSNAQTIGRVETVNGTATATRADGTRVTLDKDSTIHAGDIIETAAGASLGIVFIDKTTFAIGENARMVLDEMIFDPGSNDVSSVTSLLQGAFVIITGEIGKLNPESVVINTPAAQIGIRGTGMAFNINQVGAESTYTLLFGAIVVLNSITEVLLDNPLNAVTFTSFNLPPGPVFPLSQEQFDNLFGTTKGISDQLEPFSVNLGEINPGAGGNDPGGVGGAGDSGTVDPNVSQGALSSPPEPSLPAAQNFFTGPQLAETFPGSGNEGGGVSGSEGPDPDPTSDGNNDVLGGGTTTPSTAPTFALLDDAYNVPANIIYNVVGANVLTNDTPLNQQPLFVTGFDLFSAHNAIVDVNPDGSFSYDPTNAAAFQNLLIGQTLNDTFTYTAGDGVGGDQTATVTVAVSGTLAADIIGGPGGDILIGDANANIIQALGGNDFLTGGQGNDLLFGGPGDDTYFYNGGDGVDLIIDTGGFDILSLDSVADDSVTNVLRAGDNLVVTFSDGGAVVGVDHFAGTGQEIEQVTIPSSGDTLNIRADVTQTDGSDELLAGGDNADVIDGQGGDDSIFGGAGNDTLSGGLGEDDIVGGFGSDTLTGGAGADAFEWGNPGELTMHVGNTPRGADSGDTLTDFQSGVDTLEFDSASFGFVGSFALTEGNEFYTIAGVYDGTNSGHPTANAHFVYSQADDTLYYDNDPTSAGYSIVATVGPGGDDIQASDVEVFSGSL